ncbi:MAG: hypothetical protein IJT09_06170 [Abditibacteriota bacterium]|nr:hypothetical protein [Abditibacteriota bacterium]
MNSLTFENIKNILKSYTLVDVPTKILYESRTRIHFNGISTCSSFIKYMPGQDIPVLNEDYIAFLSPENQELVKEDYARLVEIYKRAKETGKTLYRFMTSGDTPY